MPDKRDRATLAWTLKAVPLCLGTLLQDHLREYRAFRVLGFRVQGLGLRA